MSTGRRRSDPTTEADPAVVDAGAPTATGRRSGRKAAQEAAREARKADNARKLRKYRWPALGAVLLLVVIVGAVLLRGGGDEGATPSASGRGQSTLLVQVVPQVGRATVGNALTAADPSASKGVFLALPSQLITSINGTTTTLDQSSVVGTGAAAGQALADQLGVLVDGSWVLTAPSMAGLVDKVGGVTVDVDTDVTTTVGGTSTVLVPAGTARALDGAQAVAYATFLGPEETEADRMARFTTVWGALLAKLPGDVDAMRNLVAGNAGSVSTLAPDALAAYLVTLHDAVRSDSVAYPTLPTVVVDTGTGPVTYRVDAPKVPALIKTEFAGSLPPTRPGGPVTVVVQNGVGTPGLVEKARPKLVAAGLTFQAGGNATRLGYATSLVLIPDASAKAQADGAATAAALGLPATAVRQGQQATGAGDILVILGSDFAG